MNMNVVERTYRLFSKALRLGDTGDVDSVKIHILAPEGSYLVEAESVSLDVSEVSSIGNFQDMTRYGTVRVETDSEVAFVERDNGE